ncbi:hypothetical protein BJ165DRAFT_1518503 [Panaeolus papilionaceus]|nr:hypothetical protein BJ165DRAFT_1518503 [Panaeolus papilionaceus]
MQLRNAFLSPIKNCCARLLNITTKNQHPNTRLIAHRTPPQSVPQKSANTQRPLPNGDNF